MLSEAIEGAYRVAALVRDLKTFSHSGEEKIEPIDLGKAIDRATKMTGNEIRHRAQLEVECPSGILILGNRGRILQVLINLLTNAAHAIEPGFSESNFIRVTVQRREGRVLLEVTDTGSAEPRLSAPEADLRTDLPKYRVFRNGLLERETHEVRDLWRDDSVAFLIGSSLTFDQAMVRAGIPRSKEVWVLNTTLKTAPAGRFQGPMVVTMRWMTPAQAVVATQLTGRFPANHGAPIHIGNPADIGADLHRPIYGEPVHRIPKGTMPVFWACGVTPQKAAEAAKLDLMITHAPGHGFITDLKADQICLP